MKKIMSWAALMLVLAIDAENAPGVQAECAAKIEIVKEISLK